MGGRSRTLFAGPSVRSYLRRADNDPSPSLPEKLGRVSVKETPPDVPSSSLFLLLSRSHPSQPKTLTESLLSKTNLRGLALLLCRVSVVGGINRSEGSGIPGTAIPGACRRAAGASSSAMRLGNRSTSRTARAQASESLPEASEHSPVSSLVAANSTAPRNAGRPKRCRAASAACRSVTTMWLAQAPIPKPRNTRALSTAVSR
mmetsp:Transcript_19124/g.44440  ORF Transcript_19124/g.44440 Transcript_19124/m.44440 type:complete len:203 (+) Transcript_19124:423-1031(+)